MAVPDAASGVACIPQLLDSDVFIETTGTGPDLVLLHGWGMHGGIFRPLREQLESRWTVHVVDLPGHGRSRQIAMPETPADLAAGLLARLPRAVWLGWSLGALVAQQAAISAPDRVPALAVLAGSPRFVVADDWPHAVDAAVFKLFAQDLAQDWRGTVERFLALEVVGSAHAQDELRDLRAQVFDHGEPSSQVLARGLEWLEQTDLRAALPMLRMPSLWIGGRRDRLVPAAALRAAAALAPRARERVIAGAGHAPFLHHSALIAQALDELAGADADDGGGAAA